MPANEQSRPSYIPILIATGLILYSSASIIAQLGKNSQNQQRVSTLENELKQLEKRKDQLQKEVAYQQSEQFIEAEARNKLSMAKTNETVVIFPQSAVLSERDNTAQSTVNSSTQNTNYKAWLQLFWR